MPDGQIVFEITADGKHAISSVKDVTAAIEKESKNWESSAKSASGGMENNMVSMFKKISAAAIAAKVGQTLLEWGKDAIAVASDLAEVQNVVDVTFGEGAAQIDSWAKTAQTQFGLTELQAKKFTSTLGAMMKSSGMAGPEIVKMSEDLAGLAADMASFYNLDFETAFQKIRSGISGETEPLKQLGINMSVANLEAYALTQGITKAFDKMSQGEQTMLRYQYLMQATADAQGDFARTADGYANAQRRVETAIESIKASVGNMLMQVIEPITVGLANFLEELTKPKPKTVLDEFADIDLQTEKKIAEIQKTAAEAEILIDTLGRISNNTASYGASSPLSSFISVLSDNIKGLDGALTQAKNGDVSGALSSLATALSTQLSGDPDKWTTLLNAISGSLPGATDATLNDADQTAAWMEAAAKAADDLGGDYSALWTNLLQALGNNAGAAINALANGQNTGSILENLAKGANAMGGDVGSKWKPFVDALSGLDGMTDAPQNLQGIASALSENLGGDASKWETLLTAIGNKLPAVTSATKDDTSTASFLEAAAAAAKELGGDYSTYWEDLLAALGDNAGDAISALAGGTDTGSIMVGIAGGANALNSSSPGVWRSLLGALKNVDGLQGMFSDSGAAKNVKDLADALSGNSPDVSRAEAWRTFLSALQENSGALTALTKTSADETAKWLGTLADAANKLGPENAQGWNNLFSALLAGMPGLENGENGSFLANLAQEFLAMGNQSEIAKAGLQALGWSTEEIEEAQREWLYVCQDLVSTIPGLNSIVNTSTGEIKGGTEALGDYVEGWKELQTLEALSSGNSAKQAAYDAAVNKLAQARVELKAAQIEAENAQRALEEYNKANAIPNADLSIALNDANATVVELQDNVNNLSDELTTAKKELDNFNAGVDAEKQRIVKEYGLSVNETARAMTTLEAAAANDADALDQVKTALKNAADAWKELNDYQYKVRAETEQSVGQVIKGFESLGKKGANNMWEFNTPVEEAERKLINMNKQLEEIEKKSGKTSEEYKKLNDQITALNGENTKPSVQNMTDALNSQIAYMKQYQDYLAQARALGVSEDILASLSDGSKEAFDYLKALSTTSSTKEIEALNKAYADAAEASKSFTDELTAQKLAADETFDGLVSKAQEAVEGLNLGETAYSSVSETVQGIISALQDKRAAVASEVDAILDEMARLANAGSFGAGFGFGTISFSGPVSSAVPFAGSGLELGTIGNHADGLDFVPFDNYLARLHEGESVLTAAEAQVWRDFKYGQRANANAIDYGLLGTAMWENAPQMGGGNVYLNGQVVGRVISAQQADSLRAMERSGFQR